MSYKMLEAGTKARFFIAGRPVGICHAGVPGGAQAAISLKIILRPY